MFVFPGDVSPKRKTLSKASFNSIASITFLDSDSL